MTSESRTWTAKRPTAKTLALRLAAVLTALVLCWAVIIFCGLLIAHALT